MAQSGTYLFTAFSCTYHIIVSISGHLPTMAVYGRIRQTFHQGTSGAASQSSPSGTIQKFRIRVDRYGRYCTFFPYMAILFFVKSLFSAIAGRWDQSVYGKCRTRSDYYGYGCGVSSGHFVFYRLLCHSIIPDTPAIANSWLVSELFELACVRCRYVGQTVPFAAICNH